MGFQLADELARLKQQGLYRRRRIISTPQGAVVMLDGRRVINFSSNDYLGLANHPDVASAFKKATNAYGVGSGSAHLICGHSQSHHALEEALATFTGRERALLFSSGYMANVGVISALLGRGDRVFEDRLNHASLLDGGLLSGARFKRYQHNDIADLQGKLTAFDGRTLIVSDGVFSMDGDVAKLSSLAELANQDNTMLMIDDAHGLGVLGQTGGGVVEHHSLTAAQVPLLMGTLGKALGTAGAFVAGSNALIETLIQKARTYVFTTAMPAAIAEATQASLKIVMTEHWRREQLNALIKQFSLGAKQLGLRLMDSHTAIQPILVNDNQKVVDVSERLLEQGFLVSAIRPPTVPQGQARLRITLSTSHQRQQVDQLLDALEAALL